MFEHTLNPVLLDLGAIQIRWYGIMYALTFVITYIYARRRVEKEDIRLTKEDIDAFMVIATISLLIGARLFEVMIYNPVFYIRNPSQIIAVWNGGLSFHGGLLGALTAGMIYSRKKKISFLHLADIFIVPLALGQALGRIGNFFNGELYGRITGVLWAFKFPGAEGYRHPSQLYEAFYDLIIFGTLLSIRNRKKKHGTLLALFLIMYSIFRTITELFREPDFYIGPFTAGQFLNLFVFAGGILLLIWIRRSS